MRVQFICDWLPAFGVPDANRIVCYAPQTVTAAGNETNRIRHGFASSIGTRALRDEVLAAHHILILADDVSRPTPAAKSCSALTAIPSTSPSCRSTS